MSRFLTILCYLSLFYLLVLGLGLGLAIAPSPTTTPEKLTNSLHIVVNAAINHAIDALNSIKLQQSNSPTMRQKAALFACSEFYSLTIIHLNKTLNPNSTSFDVQIWLSSVLTNLDNCKTTITEQNVTYPIFLHNNNASELIRNSLAINDELMKENMGHHDDSSQRWFPNEDIFSFPEIKEDSNAIVVAQDGSGNFRTIKEGLEAAQKKPSNGKTVIHVKQGTYREYLDINPQMKNIMLVGDGIGKTIITGNRSAKSGQNTRDSSTVIVTGVGFVARDITFSNMGGREGGQGVALLSSSDQSAFHRCAFEGYQDTLWVDSNRQFFQECQIYGSMDFIFGNAAAVFSNSTIYLRPPLKGQQVVITAHGRGQLNQPTGFSFIKCNIQPDPNQKQALVGFVAYLGRPWRNYARVVYMKSSLDGMVDPTGWMDWDNRSSTVYFAEYQNSGPGSTTVKRVKWNGFKLITDVREAMNFSVSNFINGEAWIGQTGVPYSGSLFV